MFKELFQTDNSSQAKDKPSIGQVRVEISSKRSDSSLAKTSSKNDLHSGKNKFQSSGVAFETEEADLDCIEDEVSSENKENLQRYKLGSNLEAVFKKKTAGTLQFSDFITANQNGELTADDIINQHLQEEEAQNKANKDKTRKKKNGSAAKSKGS